MKFEELYKSLGFLRAEFGKFDHQPEICIYKVGLY